MGRVALVALTLLALAAGSSASTAEWQSRASLPEPRTEVAAARFGGEIAVVGGLTALGEHSARVDVYSPSQDRWRRVRDLPESLHHAMAVGHRGRLFVLGGYRRDGSPSRNAYVYRDGRWLALPRMPSPRAAAGAAVVRGRIVVAGGVERRTGRRLARSALAFDLTAWRWQRIPGPTAREHLGVTALAGVVYAVAGRTSGLDTNVALLESWRPGDRRWTRLPAVPDARGGTGAAALRGQVVSVGGEELAGTIGEVYAYRASARRWGRLEDLPTPRHGLGVVAFGGTVFVLGGGPDPGLTVSGANEALQIAG